jgi:hypothetical protein
MPYDAQRYYAIKEIWNHRYTTKESAIAVITAFAAHMREVSARTLDQILPYIFTSGSPLHNGAV